MMKDPDLAAPMRLSPKEEHGWYLFFDVKNWRRERVRILNRIYMLFAKCQSLT
jgi:CCR4-NOT transcription complex subunit 2